MSNFYFEADENLHGTQEGKVNIELFAKHRDGEMASLMIHLDCPKAEDEEFKTVANLIHDSVVMKVDISLTSEVLSVESEALKDNPQVSAGYRVLAMRTTSNLRDLVDKFEDDDSWKVSREHLTPTQKRAEFLKSINDKPFSNRSKGRKR